MGNATDNAQLTTVLYCMQNNKQYCTVHNEHLLHRTQAYSFGVFVKHIMRAHRQTHHLGRHAQCFHPTTRRVNHMTGTLHWQISRPCGTEEANAKDNEDEGSNVSTKGHNLFWSQTKTDTPNQMYCTVLYEMEQFIFETPMFETVEVCKSF